MLCKLPTTIDNPYNPFDEWAQWYAYDVRNGYDTTGLLARITHVSIELPSEYYQIIVNDAVELFVQQSIERDYIVVTKEIDL